ncbi:Short chain dehydrogenase andI [Lasiodiplodia hormozganensis]|uniref:Short chain dehydrogenase andI n=1 Tax=Lasiodiplodia hormozganensis TaxID=869390 RepID=A0AA39XYU4_9PEZI|nr:Short chain dehydrogenase andI [Lasiodiplodia hormozganensis]
MDADAFTKPFKLTKTMRRSPYAAIDPANPSLSAAGKVVIVTGAGGGKVAQAWSQAGAKAVVLVGRSADALNDVASGLPQAAVHAADVTSEKGVEALFTSIKEKYGRLDALVNAAGTMHHDAGIKDISPNAWWQDFVCSKETNVKATFLTTHFYAKLFGGSGTIVNVVSLAAFLSAPTMSSYAAAKLAQIMFGELVGLEHPALRVFSVHPGLVEAEHGRGMVVPSFTPFAKDKAALTAGLSLFLATDPRAEMLTGTFLSANWDVDEVLDHVDEIVDQKLLNVAVGAKLGPDGHPWAA